MPKQIVKMEQFHGGLNSNSDPRDIAPNELSEATDIMVDDLGKIRTMGGTAAHAADSNPTVTIEPGYGLFQFSHDRTGGHVNVTDLSGTHTGSANQDGTASNPLVDGVASFPVDSLIGATLNNTTDGSSGTIDDNAATTASVDDLTGGTGDDWDASDVYTITAFPETGEDYLVLANTAVFTDGTCDYNNDPTIAHNDDSGAIKAGMAVSGEGIPGGAYVATVSSNTAFELSTATTGGSFTDEELTFGGGLQIYARNNDKWSTGAVSSLGETTGMKPVFYAVDGALRVSDASFGANNANIWYGYIDRNWFPNTGDGSTTSQWYSTAQSIMAPQQSFFDDGFAIGEPGSGTTHIIDTGTATDYVYETQATIHDAGGWGTGSVYKCTVPFTFTVTTGWGVKKAYIRIKAGPYDTTAGWLTGAIEKTVRNNWHMGGTYDRTASFYYDLGFTSVDHFDWNASGSAHSGTEDTKDQWRVDITASTQSGSSMTTTLSNVTVVKATDNLPALASGGELTNGYVTGNNICMMYEWGTDTSGSGWNNAGDTGAWKTGVTFIYDEVQESQITELADEADGSTVQMNLADSGATMCPEVLICIADPDHDGAGDGDGTTWNRRVTGCNIYVQDMGQDETKPWFQIGTGNFLTGKFKINNTQKEIDAEYNDDAANQSYYFWHIERTDLPSPPNIITYEDSSGIPVDEKSIDAKFKTAIIANRQAYIGNVQIETDIYPYTETLGDTMMKSPVNKFDVFPFSRRIDASIRDGDEIVKLEEYADRLLQFKKNKMHLFNISQEIEFIEDTFMHKGVSHPAAVCKTDFGIAWVNRFGCYLYDGQKVVNLIEKGGRQIIKDRDWINFLTADKDLDGSGVDTELTPMIGYVPKKRQLVVFDDITSGSRNDPRMFLYDMVTQSWVKGSDQGMETRTIDIAKTNFVVDWNGDLVYAHTSGTVKKWDDTSQFVLADDFEVRTKDLDFGQPGVRKKVYRIYITYKTADSGSVLPNMTVDYDVDGGTTFPYDFQDGTNFTSNKLIAANGWQVAELKPDVSSEANNIKSFRLRIGKNTNIHTGTATAGTSTTIALDGSASSSDDAYNGYVILISSGTGVGQVRTITDYDATGGAAEKLATVATWGTNPDNTSQFKIGVTPAGFEINDISIVYRLKNIK